MIVQHETVHSNILAIELVNGEKALALFSFEEEAELFFHCELSETNWQVRGTTTGELVSVLYGPCAGIRKVALDPLPRKVCEGTNGLLSWGRDDFVRALVSERGAPRITLGRG